MDTPQFCLPCVCSSQNRCTKSLFDFANGVHFASTHRLILQLVWYYERCQSSAGRNSSMSPSSDVRITCPKIGRKPMEPILLCHLLIWSDAAINWLSTVKVTLRDFTAYQSLMIGQQVILFHLTGQSSIWLVLMIKCFEPAIILYSKQHILGTFVWVKVCYLIKLYSASPLQNSLHSHTI